MQDTHIYIHTYMYVTTINGKGGFILNIKSLRLVNTYIAA